MPEPLNKYNVNSKISYPLANDIANKMCGKVKPNNITFLCLLLSIYILYNIRYKPCNYKFILGLCVVRAFLDILDGAIARECDEQSEDGAKFDLYCDIFFVTSILILLFMKVYYDKKVVKMKYFYPVLVLAIMIMSISPYESKNKTAGFWQDNDLITKPIAYTTLVYLASRC